MDRVGALGRVLVAGGGALVLAAGRAAGRLLALGRTWPRLLGPVATVIVDVAVAVALVLALHVAFVVLGANPGNPIVETVQRFANLFIGYFRHLFTPADAKLEVAVNYGVAALAYLLLGVLLARAVRRLGALAS